MYYDETLQSLLERYTPFKSSVQCTQSTSLWFGPVCRRAKVKMRHIWEVLPGNSSSHDISEMADSAFHFQIAYIDYWSTAISSCSDFKTLWQKIWTVCWIQQILWIIRVRTADAPLPTIRPTYTRSVLRLNRFKSVTLSEVTKAIRSVPCKQCALYPVLT